MTMPTEISRTRVSIGRDRPPRQVTTAQGDLRRTCRRHGCGVGHAPSVPQPRTSPNRPISLPLRALTATPRSPRGVCLDDRMGRVTTRVRRTRLDVDTGDRVDRTDTVAVEEPLEIRVGDEPLTTTMRTPGDDFDLAIGHLLTEAMLHSAAEVGTLMHCTDLDEDGSPTFNVVDVTLAPGAVLHRPARERTETISSACGVCGVGDHRRGAHQQPVRRLRGRRRRLTPGAGRAARGAARPAAGVRPHRWGARGGAGHPGRRAARRARGRRPAQRRRQGRRGRGPRPRAAVQPERCSS